ncbi:MAG: tRNA(adenine34) deaminase [Saprospiraceae bacterium]|jgi:tRNA(adenine34) deaminase
MLYSLFQQFNNSAIQRLYMLSIQGDDYFMRQALKEAQKAYDEDEVPVGAVIVFDKKIIARAHNQTEMLTDVTAHAEILAVTAASDFLGSKYLQTCTLYVTLEPCIMCAGAAFWAQFGRVVYGAGDDQRGFMRYGRELLHPKTKIEYGVLHEECSQIMRRYFEEKRV